MPRRKRSSAPGSSMTRFILGVFVMTDRLSKFLALERSIRTPALIGTYMMHWATVEAGLNHCIAKALGLNHLQGLIVCKNISLRDKINVLKAVINLEIWSENISKHYIAAVNRLALLSQDRNMIAHDMFVDDDEGNGVKFLVAKAKGKLSIPDVRWTVQHFIEKWDDLVVLGGEMYKLSKYLETLPTARAGLGPLFSALGFGPLQSHPSQSLPGLMNSATPQTPEQTPSDKLD